MENVLILACCAKRHQVMFATQIWNGYGMDAMLRLALILSSVFLLSGGPLLCIVYDECCMHMGPNISMTFDKLSHTASHITQHWLTHAD